MVDAQHGAFYMSRTADAEPVLEQFASYAHVERKQLANHFALGEGLVGQAALEKKPIVVRNVPADYVRVASGLGDSPPRCIVVVPILFEGEVKGVIELASLQMFSDNEVALIDQLRDSLGIVIATIEATMRTDELLRRSQGMAEELQTQQDELQQTNEELEEKARQLTEQRDEVEMKNHEVEMAKQALEEKAEQLALTSKYKSQFLANMSHELRTPLNSLLILSRRLADNPRKHLDADKLEYARTIHDAGSDLMDLIDEILDLAKVESGTMAVHVDHVSVDALEEYLERSFRQVADDRDLGFTIDIDGSVPPEIVTDEMRLRQVLRNLLSNAFKFTHQGGVTVRVEVAESGWSPQGSLKGSGPVVAFRVIDTGIGIAEDEQQIIFEAFQQSDGGTSRRYRGTGLGLSISRELATLLGGELCVESHLGEGSAFSLYLPMADTARSSLPPRADGRERGNGNGNGKTNGSGAGRVLLFIDDDPSLGERFARAGQNRGWRAVVAPTARAGLAMAHELSPAVIALNSDLPETDTHALVEQLRRDPLTSDATLFVTGEAGEPGVDSLRVRPFDTRQLVRLLDEADARLQSADIELRGRRSCSRTTTSATSSPSPRSWRVRASRSSTPKMACRPSSASRRTPTSMWC